MVGREPTALLPLHSLPLPREISNPGDHKPEEKFHPILLRMSELSDASRMVGLCSFPIQEVIKGFCSIDMPWSARK